jgi:outer membrane receptor protein involved in Fe transport
MVHEAWSPRAGAVVALANGVAVFGQVSRAFKAPTLEQLFDPRPFPDFRGGTFLISTPALRPQRATNVEGGMRQSLGRLRWELVVYRMRVRDEIDFDPRTFTYANIGRSAHDGVEAEMSAFQGRPLAIDVNYTWTRAIPEGSANQLKNIPRHVLRPGITLLLPSSTTVYAGYTRTSGAFADDDNRVSLDGRSTIDVRIAKRVSRLRLRLDLMNVGADRYEEVGYVLPDFRGGVAPYFYPAPGFSTAAGVDIIWGNR